MEFNQILLMAVLVEAIVNGIKPVYDKEKGWNKDLIMALGFSILIAVLGGIDAFEAVGLPLSVPFVGAVLTGIVASRGANIVHDLIKIITSFTSRAADPMRPK